MRRKSKVVKFFLLKFECMFELSTPTLNIINEEYSKVQLCSVSYRLNFHFLMKNIVKVHGVACTIYEGRKE